MTVEAIVEKKNKDRREGKGRVISLSRRVYRIQNSDVFYVESESKDGMYYYVMYNTPKEFEWCSCPDYDRRHQKCKHIHGVEFAIKGNTVIDTDKLPKEAVKDNRKVSNKSYKEDDYSF